LGEEDFSSAPALIIYLEKMCKIKGVDDAQKAQPHHFKGMAGLKRSL